MRYKYGLFKQGIDQTTGQQKEYATTGWSEATRGKSRDRKSPTRISSTGKSKATLNGFRGNKLPRSRTIPRFQVTTRRTASLCARGTPTYRQGLQLDRLIHSDYKAAMGPTNLAQQMMAVLYPGDATKEGKALRLSQHMLCSASVQDILARWKERGNTDWGKVAGKSVRTNERHSRR